MHGAEAATLHKSLVFYGFGFRGWVQQPASRCREERNALGQHVRAEEVTVAAAAAAAAQLLSDNAGQARLHHAALLNHA